MTTGVQAPPHPRTSPPRRRGRFLLLFVIPLLALCTRLDGTLHSHRPSHLLLDRTGRFLGEVPGSHDAWGYWPTPETIPEKVVVTTLETEDRNFFEHPGIHLPSIARAAWQNARNQRVISGASTIPMQLARLQHPRARTLVSKAIEASEALYLVHRHGHDAVLRQYLTVAPYGNQCHGVVRAARLYFDKPIDDLSWLQAAYLAALPQQPGRMSPWSTRGHHLALTRAQRILKQLHARRILSDEDLRIALNTDLQIVPRPRRNVEAMHFILAAARDVKNSPDFMHRTTIDLDVQRTAYRALTENLARVRGLGASNTAGLVVDVTTGDVLASVGSADYFDADARGAIDYLATRRSPGSALKPFIYGLALEKGTHTAATVLADTPVEFETANGGLWAPENITHTFLGPMLLREALGNSRNIPALRVLAEIGIDEALTRFERGGVKGIRYTPDAYGLSLAIGALPVTPTELATLYTALANRGETRPLRTFVNDAPGSGQRVLSADASQLIAHILSDPNARRPAFPVNGPLDFEHAVSVKTGTSQGYRDAWAVAFDDRLLVVSWLGNHDWRRMNLASGATAAAPAVHRILETVSPTRLPHLALPIDTPLPSSLVKRDVCAISGALPGEGCTHLKSEWFIPGSEPHESCPFHVAVAIDLRNGLRAGPDCPAKYVQRRQLLDLPDTYEPWARKQRLTIAPSAYSPLCPVENTTRPRIAIREPRTASRYLFDPDTPRELSTVRFSAQVSPANEEIVWLVDGTPVGRVGYPHELRWPMTPGKHVIRARLALSGETTAAVTLTVED
ncbi:MAG: penicillin-binding protein 1C [Archangium gephyra]|uniref:peptidoglycan glycosyltransferase n=1 Tax=Archangium gephyra TaxID=48 RepID=A0A2W5V851_9BACT|nr:MAG: penicillin-binding protein 1C [Archangium gephyra]